MHCSLGWKGILAVGAQGILSAAARVEEHSGSRGLGTAQVTVSVAAYSPSLGKVPQCNSSVSAGEGFPSKVVTAGPVLPSVTTLIYY